MLDFWTEGRVATLRELWASGMLAATIGIRLGTSKNAVVGKVHRLGLKPRPSPIKRSDPKNGHDRTAQGKTVLKPRAKPQNTRKLGDFTERLPSSRIEIRTGVVSSARPCQWPMWDDDTPMHERTHCGRGSLVDSHFPFCPEHNSRGCIPVKKKVTEQ